MKMMNHQDFCEMKWVKKARRFIALYVSVRLKNSNKNFALQSKHAPLFSIIYSLNLNGYDIRSDKLRLVRKNDLIFNCKCIN